MGRRKIEIKAIKDDRNRSVTFLKRKGGLFKKAHELSVLCSVDVAVIIFGNNKKLYEYSSGDIGEILQRYQFYGGANEHKGPADFNGKKDLDDDDDDDMGTPPQEHNPQMMPPQYQHPTNQFQHIRHHTASASPPIPNGVPFHHPQQRQHTPQPHQISRPASRNDGPRRVSSNLSHHGMPQVSVPPQGVNGFAYMPNPSIYNPNASPMPPGMPQHPHQPPPPQQQQPSFQYPAPPAPQHLQQAYMEEARRQSMPPAFPQVERAASIPHGSPPQPQQPQIPQHHQQQQQQQQQIQPQQTQPQPQPQPKQEQAKHESRQQMLEPIKKASKSRSIFTPIDEDRSVLSKHWASSTTAAETLKIEPPANRSQSVDVAAVSRNGNGAIAPPPSPPKTAQLHKKDRNISTSSIDFQPPSRTNSGMSQMGPNAKRPRLKVQIPDEPSDNDSQTAGSNNSAQGTNSSHPSRPNAGTDSSQSGGPGSTMGIMTLPPPSPSTSTIQSAGATGPPNPFARPLPPSNTNSHGSNPNQSNQNSTNGTSNGVRGSSGTGLAELETPVSALPSRFMNEFLPSPSSFFSEWGYRSGKGGDSAGGMGMELQSPLNFATPVVGSGPSFLRDDSMRDKEVGLGLGSMKRKSPDGEGEGSVVRADEAKRVKHEA